MIDIHNHSLYGVDDGAKSLEESIEMICTARKQGIDTIILTPHYRHGMFPYQKEVIEEHFEELKKATDELDINLYLGCEYHANSEMVDAFRMGRCEPLAGGDFVLTEYSYETEYSYIVQNTRLLLARGYIPVIAHVERYLCFFCAPKCCKEIQQLGAMIQINADSILGLNGGKVERFCRKILKKQWVDIVASDAHGINKRKNHLRESMEYVNKRYGMEYTQKLFLTNPEKIIAHIK